MSDERPTTEQLLAAYASGALRGAEAAEVEELIARDPAARAELDALRTTLSAVRAVEPRPAVEPDWEQMTRAIRAACAERARPSFWARLRAALRPRHAVLGLAVTAAAAVLIVMQLRGRGGDLVAVSPPPDAAIAAPVQDLRIAEVDDLDEEELAALDVAIGPETLTVPEAGDPDRDALDDPDDEIDAGDVEAWTASGESLALDQTSLELGLFEESSYDDVLSGLSEEDLDALEAALADG